jgi:UDP-N-acetylmuramate--alanine ligase
MDAIMEPLNVPDAPARPPLTSVPVSAPDPVPAEALGAVHFIGIGGAGMSGIARIMLARSLRVSGSDLKESRALAALRVLGATVNVGHDPAHIDGSDTVVYSSAIRDKNTELAAARERGLTVIPRAGALASLMAGRRGVAVAGTHGKTTTTSMLTVALQHCGADPSFVIGGDLNEPGSGAHHGTGDLFVAEADESDRSFLLLRPHAAVVTNVEADHLDHYDDLAAIQAAFASFVDGLDPTGFLVACADDPGAWQLALHAQDRGIEVRTYGTSESADVRVVDLSLHGLTSRFELIDRGRRLGSVELVVPGHHYALDAAAAITAGLMLGQPFGELAAGLSTFRGARRRMEFKGTAHGVRVYDSYAHHPTELRADLVAARTLTGGGRLVVAFQPHLFTRTEAFAADFGAALGLADDVVVMEIYAAREDPVPGVTGALVAGAVPLPAERVLFEPSWSAVAGRVVERARSGDVVLTLGAGDVTMLGPEILELLQAGKPT